MTDEEMAEEYFKSVCEDYNEELERTGKRHYWVGFDIKNAYLAGLQAGKEDHSKIYMLGRKDERERPCSLCKNPISICVRCERRKHCEGSDTGAYVSGCEDFIYKENEHV